MNEKEREELRQKYRASLQDRLGKEIADKWYRKELEESLAGYQSQFDKECAEEKERITNELLETAIAEVFAIVKRKFGVELVEDPENDEIIIDNLEILGNIVAILKEVSPLLAHPESKHVSIELTRASGEFWNIKIVNRAE